MKKTIFTLLATASLLAATPVLAMKDEVISTITRKPRPYITDTVTELSDPTIVTDFETHGSIVAKLSTGEKGVFIYDETHAFERATLVDAIRTKKLFWTEVEDYSNVLIQFRVELNGDRQTLYFDIDRETTESTKPTSAKPTYENPKLLEGWEKLGLLKTDPLPVKEGQKLTVTCKFINPATEDTAIDFLNTAQNGYYDGGVIVKKGEIKAAFSSVVPAGETQTWLILRNLAFDGVTELPLGVGTTLSLNIE
ncbi:MAG: hypothetical protein HYX35_04650 [Proteobacteria bacterium]|nr:hypothetical protein [Pseudomonadota bacterium]